MRASALRATEPPSGRAACRHDDHVEPTAPGPLLDTTDEVGRELVVDGLVHEHALHRRVEQLEGLLPICAFCKSIRNKAGNWEPIETYISERSHATFSHGICPDCSEKMKSDLNP